MARFAKLGALVAIVGLTALPFASCGAVDFMGHEILRNEPPDADRLAKDTLGPLFQGMADAVPSENPGATTKVQASEGPLFGGDDRWLHWLYVAVALLAVLALALPLRVTTHAALAVLGIGGTILFLETFERRLSSQGSGSASGPSFLTPDLRWEAGAYVTLAGFGLLLAGAWALRSVVPVPRASPYGGPLVSGEPRWRLQANKQ